MAKFIPRTEAPTEDNAFYFADNIYYQSGYGMPNCTPYSVGRYNELGGNSGYKLIRNAGDFFEDAKKNGMPTGSTPKLGAIACFPNHVCNVEFINDNILKCSQSHYNGVYFDFVEIDMRKPEYKGQPLQGFIYLPFEWEEEKVYYRVQTGAYSQVDNTLNMYDRLVADGYKPIIKRYDDLYHVQVGAYSVKTNALNKEKELNGKGYPTHITTQTGVDVSVDELRHKNANINVGDKVIIKKGATDCDGRLLAPFCYTRTHDIKELRGDRAVISYNGIVVALMNLKDLNKA